MFLAIPMVVCAQENGCENPYDILVEGVELFENADYQDAFEKFERIHPNDTIYTIALYEKAYCLHMMERYDEAIELYKQGVDIPGATKLDYYNALGNAYDEKGESEKAIESYNEGLKYFPYSARLHYNKGIVLENLERWTEALEAYKDGLTVGPFHAGCHHKLGVMAANEGDLTRAILSYSLSLLCDPASKATYPRLSDI